MPSGRMKDSYPLRKAQPEMGSPGHARQPNQPADTLPTQMIAYTALVRRKAALHGSWGIDTKGARGPTEMSVSSIQPGTGPRVWTEPTGVAADAAASIFNLPDYRVMSATVLNEGQRRVIVEIDPPPGCPRCGVFASRRKERCFQRIRDIPVARAGEVLWSKYRWHCDEVACARLSFFESTAQVPRRARSTNRLRGPRR